MKHRGTEHTEEFWHLKPDRWRLIGSDGITRIQNEEQGATTIVHGRRGDVGPRFSLFFLPETMLRPARAPIWGRPGDDWRLTPEVDFLGGDLYRIGLARNEDTSEYPDYHPSGHIVMDADHGVLRELVRDEFVVRVDRFDIRSPVDVGVFRFPSRSHPFRGGPVE